VAGAQLGIVVCLEYRLPGEIDKPLGKVNRSAVDIVSSLRVPIGSQCQPRYTVWTDISPLAGRV
jgi:hypothetical protein